MSIACKKTYAKITFGISRMAHDLQPVQSGPPTAEQPLAYSSETSMMQARCLSAALSTAHKKAFGVRRTGTNCSDVTFEKC